jgi:hypothetical protein
MKRYITHYLRGPLDKNCWVSLCFITKDTDGKLHYAFDERDIDPANLAQWVTDGDVIPLQHSWPVEEGQALWGTDYGDVWLASEHDPIRDSSRLLVQEGALPKLPTRHEIIHRRCQTKDDVRELVYVPDDFVQSPVYSQFTECVAQALADKNGLSLSICENFLSKWEILSGLMGTQNVDFAGLPYNLNENRAKYYSVVPFGFQPSYTCYYYKYSRTFSIRDHPLFDSRISEPFKRIIKALTNDPKLEIGVLAGTTAADELLGMFRFVAAVGRPPFFNPIGHPKILKQWINENPEKRLIFCDHSVARKLDEEETATIVGGRRVDYAYSEDKAEYFYEKPLPVGFVFSEGDEHWEEDVRTATAVAIKKVFLEENLYDAFCDALLPLHVEVLSMSDLCRNFNVDTQKTDEQSGLMQA